jgi:hypothetical protein
MTETLAEGTRRTVEEVWTRRRCDECGDPATRRATYLRNQARTNPGSRGYGRTDLNYCSDRDIHLCEVCQPPFLTHYYRHQIFLGTDYPHMLFHWKKISVIEEEDNAK